MFWDQRGYSLLPYKRFIVHPRRFLSQGGQILALLPQCLSLRHPLPLLSLSHRDFGLSDPFLRRPKNEKFLGEIPRISHLPLDKTPKVGYVEPIKNQHFEFNRTAVQMSSQRSVV